MLPALTTDPSTKLLPEAVNTTFCASARMRSGETELSVGAGFMTDSRTDWLDPPPGAGLLTTTSRNAPRCSSDAGTDAIKVFAESKTAATPTPPMLTAALPEKPLPDN